MARPKYVKLKQQKIIKRIGSADDVGSDPIDIESLLVSISRLLPTQREALLPSLVEAVRFARCEPHYSFPVRGRRNPVKQPFQVLCIDVLRAFESAGVKPTIWFNAATQKESPFVTIIRGCLLIAGHAPQVDLSAAVRKATKDVKWRFVAKTHHYQHHKIP